MNLYLIQRKNYDYDEINAQVIAAKDEKEARKLAYKNVRLENPNEWISSENSDIHFISELPDVKTSYCILTEYLSG